LQSIPKAFVFQAKRQQYKISLKRVHFMQNASIENISTACAFHAKRQNSKNISKACIFHAKVSIAKYL
jgi:hypothetical protein